jgi:1-acyl-sn-glycerol-3-phosphate acyltransferase
MLYRFGRFLSKVVLCSSLKLEVRGRELLPVKGGFLLASNHVSNLDPVLLGIASTRDLSYMAKEELFRNPAFAWVLRRVHAFPVKRHTGDIGAIRTLMHRVKAGSGVVLFPEGTRQPEGKLGKAQEGIGFLAQKLQVPVVPAFVKGSGLAMPVGSSKIRRERVVVTFGKPIFVERGVAYQQTADSIMDAIKRLSW